MTKREIIIAILQLIDNGYAETHVGYHAEYREWNGYPHRGAYAQIAAPYGGTKRIYERSYAALLLTLLTDSVEVIDRR